MPNPRHAGGIEETAFIRIGNDMVRAEAEADQDRTTAEGKASSVQFVISTSHRRRSLPEAVRAELAKDFG